MYIMGKPMEKNNTPPHVNHYYPHDLCGAHARQTGNPCKAWAMANGRCRLHGGKSTGAKKPHKRITHGLRTKEAIEQRQETRELLKQSKELLKEIRN
jgi:hypothetical protein